MNLCACCSGLRYSDCCKPFHLSACPRTALELMRSRYSAYAFGLSDYIIDSTHPSNPEYSSDRKRWKRQIDDFSSSTQFQKLEILESSHTERCTIEALATVTFHAFLSQKGRDISFIEKSYFEKKSGRWLYLRGDIMTEAHKKSFCH